MLTISILDVEYSINDVDAVAKKLLEYVSNKTILIYGNMGVGKTTLIKAIVKAIGSQDDVSSPTYSIVNEYQLNDEVIYHFDLYRIASLEEAYHFGIEEYIYSNNWLLIEWPELIEGIIPKENHRIMIEEKNKKLRILKLE